MDFERQENVAKDDIIIQFSQGLRAVCDSKSLLYIFGMQLDFSHEVGGVMNPSRLAAQPRVAPAWPGCPCCGSVAAGCKPHT